MLRHQDSIRTNCLVERWLSLYGRWSHQRWTDEILWNSSAAERSGRIDSSATGETDGLLQYELLTERCWSAFYTGYNSLFRSSSTNWCLLLTAPAPVTSESFIYNQLMSRTHTMTNRMSAKPIYKATFLHLGNNCFVSWLLIKRRTSVFH